MTSVSGSRWVKTRAGSTVPLRTRSISRGMYLRWWQLPMLTVRFLFIAAPIGKNLAVCG